MRGPEFTISHDHLSISSSPSRPYSRENALDDPRKLSKSKATPAHASYSATISPQHSDGQDSDCYIIDHKPQQNRGPPVNTRASIQMERVSSIDALPAVHLPQPFNNNDIQSQDMYDPSATGDILTDHSYLESYPSSPSQHSSKRIPASLPSVGPSSLRDRHTPILIGPNPFLSPDKVIELDEEEEQNVFNNDVIDISSDSDHDEEMDVDDMLTVRVAASPELGPSSSQVYSSPSPSDIDSLFTPPSSPKPRRRLVLDHVAVPPFPRGLTTTDYKPYSNVSSRSSKKGMEHPSVGDALAAAFAQNNKPSSPPPDRKGKGRARERESAPPAPVHPKQKNRAPKYFGEGVSTVPTAILNAYYPPIKLDIPELLPYFDDTWHRNTYWIERVRFKRHHAQLHQGLPEMIAQMKSLGGPGKDQKDGPILPRILAPLFEQRADIAASLAAQWEYAPQKHSRKGRSMNISETQNIASSSNSDPPSPTFADDDNLVEHFTMLEEDQPLDFSMEMDQYLNDFGNSPPKSHPLGMKAVHAPNSYRNASHLTGFLHNTTGLPPLGARDGAVDGFLGVPPSPKHDRNLSSTLQYSDTYSIDHSHTLDDSFEHVFPEEGAWSNMPNVIDEEVVSSASVSPQESVGTIDPSLLGGNEPPPKQSPSPVIPPPNGTKTSKKRTLGPIIYVRRPPGVSATQEAPKSRGNIQIKYRMSGSVSPMDEDGVVPNKDVEDVAGWAAESVPAQPRARPSLKIRIRRSDTRASSDGSFVPSQPSTSASASPVIPSTPLPEATRSKAQEPTTAPPTKRREGGKPEVFESRCCHQCRNKTTKPKMQCSKRRQDRQICGKLFCDRCILNRYPEITFDRMSKTFVCPACTETCNCTACARKRGEKYISMRGGGFAGSTKSGKVVLIPDTEGQPQDVQSTPESAASAPQTMFWAHVYGLEGERVGRAFMGDTSATISAPPTQPTTKGRAPNGLSKSKLKPKQQQKPTVEARLKKKKPRVFIGMPLREWKVRAFRDLEPSAPIPPLVAKEDNHVGKGKGKAVERPRVYIGDPRSLYLPYSRMPVSPRSSRAPSPSPDDSGGEFDLDLDSDGSLTPLEDLEEAMDWPQPDVGEAVTVTWESVCDERSVSASLSPGDVEKAIGVALAVML